MPIGVDRGDDGIVTVTLDNPRRRNALDLAMFEALAALWPRLAADQAVRAVLLTGADGAFCSGADLTAGLQEVPGIDDLVDRALMKTALFPKPLVAAIQGPCVAGGLELLLAADIRVASEEATFGLPEVRLGILPSGGAAMKLLDQVGHAHAMDMLLTGRLVTAREAERIGLVTLVCPAGDVDRLARERAGLVASASAVAVRATKQAALAARTVGYAAREAEERRLAEAVRASGDAEAGRAAFRKGKAGPHAG